MRATGTGWEYPVKKPAEATETHRSTTLCALDTTTPFNPTSTTREPQTQRSNPGLGRCDLLSVPVYMCYVSVLIITLICIFFNFCVCIYRYILCMIQTIRTLLLRICQMSRAHMRHARGSPNYSIEAMTIKPDM